MKVKCINSDGREKFLTVGKVYEVADKDDTYYFINTNDEAFSFHKNRFIEPNLWESKHSYYCEESGDHQFYSSWEEFLENCNDLDDDLNFIFRWDWKEKDEHTVEPDDSSFQEVLLLYRVLQRKGRLTSQEILVRRDQEPEIKEWLRKKFDYLKKLWEPL
jgi:hypothetical protein